VGGGDSTSLFVMKVPPDDHAERHGRDRAGELQQTQFEGVTFCLPPMAEKSVLRAKGCRWLDRVAAKSGNASSIEAIVPESALSRP